MIEKADDQPITITLTRDDLRALDRGLKRVIVWGVLIVFGPLLLLTIIEVAITLANRH